MAACDVAEQVVGEDSHMPTDAGDLDLCAFIVAPKGDQFLEVGGRRLFGQMLFRGSNGTEVAE